MATTAVLPTPPLPLVTVNTQVGLALPFSFAVAAGRFSFRERSVPAWSSGRSCVNAVMMSLAFLVDDEISDRLRVGIQQVFGHPLAIGQIR